MKKLSITIFALFLFTVSNLFAGIPEISDIAQVVSKDFVVKEKQTLFKRTVAVLKFKNRSEKMKKYDVGHAVSALLTTELSNSTIFKLVDRESISKVMKEIELGMTGMVDADTAARAGRLSGAEFLLLGSVSEIGGKILITSKLVSVKTGEIISARDITIPMDVMIAAADKEYWSAFQSEHGISFGIDSGVIFPKANNINRNILKYSLNISYQFSKYFRTGIGFTYGGVQEFRSEKIILNNTDDNFPVGVPGDYPVEQFYHFSFAGPNLFIEVIVPVRRWFNFGFRLDYMMSVNGLTGIQQEAHGFPVVDPNSTDPFNESFISRRLVINANGTVFQIINPMIMAEFLVSKRVSLNIKAGYAFSFDYTPEIYETGGDKRQTDDIDFSGTFPSYPYYNFSRFDKGGDRVAINISGITTTVGVTLHF